MARSLLADLHPRWEHVQAAGRAAEELCTTNGLPQRVAVAAWLHDIGYASQVATTGFHPLDGARFLAKEGIANEVVRLVAWHTGAIFEAVERGLLEELGEIARPDQAELDALTMIDLATGPDGSRVLDVARVTEILSRYDEGHPVHNAVTKSRPSLLASSRRAKTSLGLSQDWPLGR